jgi:hypothetical protein
MERHNRKVNKINSKGQVADIIFILVTITGIAMTILFSFYIYDKISGPLSESSLATNESIAAYDQMGTAFPIFDTSMAFIIIGMIGALLVNSFFLKTHPIFLVINIVGFLVLVFLGAVFSNMYSEIISNPELISIASSMPVTTFIMTKMPWIGAVIIFISSIVMYSKGESY